MIVFTATNRESRDVFVGTARDSVEEEWAQLLSQADDDVQGDFFDQLRAIGAQGFDVGTWAYGETGAEARESLREARTELGAKSIKASRSKPAGRNLESVRSASMQALMATIEEAMGDDQPGFEEVQAEVEGDALEGSLDPSVIERSVTGAAKEGLGGTPTDSKNSSDQMMANRLEAMKSAQTKLLRERRGAVELVTTAKTSAPPKDTPKPRIANGRTGSAGKERRIREAIELERDKRESHRQTSGTEHAAMNAVMARVEMRRQAAKAAKAEKAKAAASAARKAATAAKAEQARVAALAVKSASPEPVPLASLASTLASVASVKVAIKRKRALEKAKVSAALNSSSITSAPTKLATGRTGSSLKEKRIKEVLELERAERTQRKQVQTADQADEMEAILARLDARGKEAEKFKRRR